GDQVFGAGDEIRESIHLLHHAAVVMPWLAHVAATADVRQCNHHATLEARQPARREVHGQDEAIGAVAIEIKRRGTVALYALLVKNRERDSDAIFGGGVDTLQFIVVAIESA